MDTNCTSILHLPYNTIPSHHMQDYFPIKRVVNISSVLYYVLCHYFLLLNGYYGQINCYDGSLPFLCFCHRHVVHYQIWWSRRLWVEDDEEEDFHGVKSTSSDAETQFFSIFFQYIMVCFDNVSFSRYEIFESHLHNATFVLQRCSITKLLYEHFLFMSDITCRYLRKKCYGISLKYNYKYLLYASNDFKI